MSASESDPVPSASKSKRNYRMIPIMTRPGNPYDNASCERFMKTLKQEEIYANEYRDLEHLSSRALRHSSNTITIDAACTGRWAIVHPKSAVETVPSRPLETRHQNRDWLAGASKVTIPRARIS